MTNLFLYLTLINIYQVLNNTFLFLDKRQVCIFLHPSFKHNCTLILSSALLHLYIQFWIANPKVLLNWSIRNNQTHHFIFSHHNCVLQSFLIKSIKTIKHKKIKRADPQMHYILRLTFNNLHYFGLRASWWVKRSSMCITKTA